MVPYNRIFFFHDSVRDMRAKQATKDLSRIQNARERDKDNPEIKQYMKTFRKQFPIILGFLKSNFVANFLDI